MKVKKLLDFCEKHKVVVEDNVVCCQIEDVLVSMDNKGKSRYYIDTGESGYYPINIKPLCELMKFVGIIKEIENE